MLAAKKFSNRYANRCCSWRISLLISVMHMAYKKGYSRFQSVIDVCPQQSGGLQHHQSNLTVSQPASRMFFAGGYAAGATYSYKGAELSADAFSNSRGRPVSFECGYGVSHFRDTQYSQWWFSSKPLNCSLNFDGRAANLRMQFHADTVASLH